MNVPDFIGLVYHSQLTGELVKLEHLENLDLEIEVEMLVILLDWIEIYKICDEFAGQHLVLLKACWDPFSQVSDDFLLS